MDIFLFVIANLGLTSWLALLSLFIAILASFYFREEDLWLGVFVGLLPTIAVIITILIGALFTPEIGTNDYQKILTLKAIALEGKLYSSESNKKLLHVIEAASANNKINIYEYTIIKEIKDAAETDRQLYSIKNLK